MIVYKRTAEVFGKLLHLGGVKIAQVKIISINKTHYKFYRNN
jgi:hypothetical protein